MERSLDELAKAVVGSGEGLSAVEADWLVAVLSIMLAYLAPRRHWRRQRSQHGVLLTPS